MATPVENEISQLARMPGVIGAAVDYRETTLAESFNRPYPTADLEGFHLLVSHMLGSLSAEDRAYQEIFFEFRSATVLVCLERDARCVVLLDDSEALPYISKAATSLLRDNYYLLQNSTTVAAGHSFSTTGSATGETVETWEGFLLLIKQLLSKVLGGAQSARLIDRVLAQQDLRRDDQVDPDRFYEIGSNIIAEVPNKGRQKALLSEMRNHLDQIHG